MNVEEHPCLLLGSEAAYLNDDSHGLLHRLYGHELIGAVEVDAAGEDIGAG
jgi:hypothetical protein